MTGVMARALIIQVSTNLKPDVGPSGGDDVHVGIPVTVTAVPNLYKIIKVKIETAKTLNYSNMSNI
jgi:hypothetical protein